MSFLPRTLTLPSGTRVTIAGAENESAFEAILSEGDPLDLPLADFNVVRAVLTKAGAIPEEEIEVDCHNCGEILCVRPCERLEIGPWQDDELDDPELDRTEELGVPIPIAPISIGRVRTARTVTLEPRTVREAMPLFDALKKEPFVVDARVVDAMGIVALGSLEDPGQIARALEEADDDAFASVTDAFLAAHYPPRLAAEVFCPKCKARNVVDAPYDREFEPSKQPQRVSREKPLPSLEAFVELAHAIADPLIAELPGERVELVVDPGVPAVDDGGEPLLGSYVPPPPAGAPVPTQPPRVTIYYRTFESAGDFDWEEELHETIEHELEHHVYWLRGDDPLDEEEHAEIDREVVRVVGRHEATRRTLAVFGTSIPDFFVRAWPLVLIAALALVFAFAEGRCN
jgi:hypothetical protein